MIVGRVTKGSIPHVLAADAKMTTRVRIPVRCYVPLLRIFVDGQGPGGGSQVARPIIYDDKDNLVAAGEETTVIAGQIPAWYDFPFLGLPDGAALVPAPGTYWWGLHGGPNGSVIRVYG